MGLCCIVPLQCFLDSNFFAESFQRVFPLKLLQLNRSILIEEFINGQKPTSHNDLDFAPLNLDCNTFGAKFINSLGFTHKHDLEFLSFRIVIYVVCKLFVNWVSFYWHINCYSSFQVNY